MAVDGGPLFPYLCNKRNTRAKSMPNVLLTKLINSWFNRHVSTRATIDLDGDVEGKDVLVGSGLESRIL